MTLMVSAALWIVFSCEPGEVASYVDDQRCIADTRECDVMCCEGEEPFSLPSLDNHSNQS